MSEPHPAMGLRNVSQNVPVFNCIVHVARDADGSITARCANLPELSCTGMTEREVLSKVVNEFKRRTRQFTENGTVIPWIDPPYSRAAEEQTRLIPVHL